MRYAFLLQEHPNIRYRKSLEKLIVCELQATLNKYKITDDSVTVEKFGTDTYLCFDLPEIPSNEILCSLSRQTGVALLSAIEGEQLRPVLRDRLYVYSEDLPHVLKYKGKTNPDFMYLMLHCALSLSDFSIFDRSLTVLDPMCGKGTGLFCALCEGYQAIGFDADEKAIREGVDYFSASLQFHKRKYKKIEQSNTIQGGRPIRSVSFQLTETGDKLTEASKRLSCFYADCASIPKVLHKNCCHIAICDLPYGVQHAPKEGGGISNLEKVARQGAIGCSFALCKGGVAAFAVNTNTLPRNKMEAIFAEAGLSPVTESPWNDYSHWVEQAITRDLVLAKKEK